MGEEEDRRKRKKGIRKIRKKLRKPTPPPPANLSKEKHENQIKSSVTANMLAKFSSHDSKHTSSNDELKLENNPTQARPNVKVQKISKYLILEPLHSNSDMWTNKRKNPNDKLPVRSTVESPAVPAKYTKTVFNVQT